MSAVAENTLEFLANVSPTSLPIDAQTLGAANAIIESTPLPTTRTEAWKYTRLAKLGKSQFQHTPVALGSLKGLTVLDSPLTFAFVNGHFSEALSTAETVNGLSIELLSESKAVSFDAIDSSDLFSAINTSYLNDGISISLAKNTVIDTPIQIIHVLSGTAQISNFKVQIEAGAFSKATVVQGFFCSDETSNAFVNFTSEIHVRENAHLTVDKIQNETTGNYHISTDAVSQDKDSTFTINTMTLNGGFVRNNLNISVIGENCTTNLNGTYLLKEKQHVDNHTVVDHRVPNCQSNELYKGVMDDNSTAVFNGKVFVQKDAQKINAFQSNRNVLLSNNATANSKPELEIYADDVKCSHGSTTGQLDDDAIFYLQARGISKRAATQLLVSAFIAEVIEKIENTEVKQFVFDRLKERFGWNVNPEDFG